MTRMGLKWDSHNKVFSCILGVGNKQFGGLGINGFLIGSEKKTSSPGLV